MAQAPVAPRAGTVPAGTVPAGTVPAGAVGTVPVAAAAAAFHEGTAQASAPGVAPQPPADDGLVPHHQLITHRQPRPAGPPFTSRPPMTNRIFRPTSGPGRMDAGASSTRAPDQRPTERDARSKQRRKRDCELMARVAVGDTDAFSEVWGYYRRWLAWHLYQRGIMDPDGVNDVLQEVCIKILRGAHKYDPHLATVGTWLLLLIENCVYVRRTKQRRLQSYRFIPIGEKYELTSEDQFDMDVSRNDSQTLIRLALDRLAPMLREVLDLRFFQGMEIEQIAVMQRVPEHTVRGRIERGVKELRWHFRDELKRLGAGVVRGRPVVPRLITRFVEE